VGIVAVLVVIGCGVLTMGAMGMFIYQHRGYLKRHKPQHKTG